MKYKLLSSGNCCKIEQFGDIILSRPCDIAVWPLSNNKIKVNAFFSRKKGNMKWKIHKDVPRYWTIAIDNIKAILKLTDFGHIGLFYEHSRLWDLHKSLYDSLELTTPKILNLFAYTGVGTVKMAKDGCFVTHVDSSKSSVNWAKENAILNDIDHDKIRWIVEDVTAFLKREARRGNKYDAIILDPPSFGRGAKGEVFKLEKDLWELLNVCKLCLNKHNKNAFVTLSSHSEGFSEHILERIMFKVFNQEKGEIKKGVLEIGENDELFPVGYYASWIKS